MKIILKQVQKKNIIVLAAFFSVVAVLLSYLSSQISLLAVLVFLLTGLLIIKIEWALYLMIIALPVIHWDFTFGNLVIPLSDLVGLAVLLAFFLRRFLELFLGVNQRKRLDIEFPFLVPFLLFWVTTLISALLAPDIPESLWYSVRWILFFYLVFVVVPYNIILEKKNFRTVLYFFTAVAVLVSVIGLWSLLGQNWYNEFVRVKPIAVAGIFPLGENQNLLVEVFLPAIFMILALADSAKAWLERRVFLLAAVLVSATLVATFSRGAWLSLLVCGCIYLFNRYRRELPRFFLPIILLAVIFIPAFFYMYKLQTAYVVGVSSTENRMLMNKITWQAFKDAPLFGQGTGEYVNLVAENIRFKTKYGQPLDSHGVMQKVIAENGLAGLYTFLLFLFFIAKELISAFKRYGKRYQELSPLLLAPLSIFIFELFNTSYYKGKFWLPVAVALAAVAMLRKNIKAYE